MSDVGCRICCLDCAYVFVLVLVFVVMLVFRYVFLDYDTKI